MWENGGMSKLLEVIDRNKPWKIYRHSSAYFNLLRLIGVPKGIAGLLGGAVAGVIIAWISYLPVWGMVLLGLGATILVLVIMLLSVSLWQGFIKPSNTDPSLGQEKTQIQAGKTYPTMQNFSKSDSLNLIITNEYEPQGLFEENGFVHSLKRFDFGRKQWGGDILPDGLRALTKDDSPPNLLNLKYQVPRMFQLVEFNGQPKPIVRWRTKTGEARQMALPGYGDWQLTMQLRWAGDSMPPFKRWFRWDETLPQPDFCDEPH